MDTGNPEHNQGAIAPPLTGLQIVEAARAFLGVPYQHQGRNTHGLDCAGLVLVTMQAHGQLPEALKNPRYARSSTAELVRYAAEYCQRLDGPEVGALVLMKWPGQREPGHSGLVTDRGPPFGLIHAVQQYLRVVEHRLGAPWSRMVHSYWRLPGVGNG